MHKLLATSFLALALGVAPYAGLSAQEAGGANAGGSGGASDSGSSTGGTTGQLTTTPEAKSEDAAGTAGTAVEPAANTDAGDHGCTETQMWDAAKQACVDK